MCEIMFYKFDCVFEETTSMVDEDKTVLVVHVDFSKTFFEVLHGR